MTEVTNTAIDDVTAELRDDCPKFIEVINVLTDELRAAHNRINELGETVEQQAQQLQEKTDRIETLEEELAQHKDHTGREFADVRGRITEVENQQTEPHSEDATPGVEREGIGSQDDRTPLERIATTPEHQVDQLGLTANQERARFIAKGVHDYAEKAPAGLVISSGDIKKVIAAKEGNRPHNQTVARIMDFLDDFGQDDVDLIKRRGRNLIVVEPDAADRLMACNDRCDGGSGPAPSGTVTSGG